jgi:hypothetical protein
MDSEEVNSISDNTEAMQVAYIIRDNYYNAITGADPPELWTFFSLEASGDPLKPTLMTLPTNIDQIEWVKYDNQTATDTDVMYRDVQYLDMDTFLRNMLQLSTDTDNVEVFTHAVDGNTFSFFVYNNKAPQYYTTFDDYTLIFDSYNSAEDTTLQKSKTMCYGLSHPTFTLSDSFQVDLDTKQYSLLLNESKAQAFAELKQVNNVNAERKARQNWVSFQRTKRRIPGETELDRLPNYGRRTTFRSR